MQVRIINQFEVQQLLPMAKCLDVMTDTLAALGRGQATNPLRQTLWLPEEIGVLASMPASLGNEQTLGIKVITVFPGNHGSEYDSHQGAVLLFEAERGRLLAIVDASAITAIRTAAVSGVATRLLARAAADDLAILGSGVQARSHLAAMMVARQLRRVRVWSRTFDHAQAFAGVESKRHGIKVEAMSSVEDAVTKADIICTTTSTIKPILKGEWLSPGVHINAVGSSVPFARELDTEAVVKSRLFVDRRESTLNEAGDFLLPKEEGTISNDHIQGEIGELILGQILGRQSSEEITLFKSLGLAVEDVAAATTIYRKAIELGVGVSVELGGRRLSGI